MAAARVMRRRAAVLAAAVALDLALGEPPGPVHPVVWLGRAIGAADRGAPGAGRARQLAWGATVALGVPLAAAGAAATAARLSGRLGRARVPAEAALLKSTFAVRALLLAGRTVRRALERGDDSRARHALRGLVSRDTDALAPGLVAAAAIESLAENTTDSFLAPWLAYGLFGLPGAVAYRAMNTLDSMIGYRGRYEYLGKAAARLDDLLNAVPARLAAALIALAAPAGPGSPAGAVRGIRRHRRRTASPNAGWTMAAMAGALGVRLEKRGAYVLGDGPEPAAKDIARAERVVGAVALLGLGLSAGAMLGAARLPRPDQDTRRTRPRRRATAARAVAAGAGVGE